MLQKIYSIYSTDESHFDQMCQSLLTQIGRESEVIKIVFFGAPQNNEEYLTQFQTLTQSVAGYFSRIVPPISYVAQDPSDSALSAEVVTLAPSQNFSTSYGENYLVLNNGICRELITGGILPPDLSASVSVQSNAVFAQIDAILKRENFPINSIVRQWNYIKNIASFDDGYQNYQEFNDSRSQFYAKGVWRRGYPAATGIGTSVGGIMIEVIAVLGNKLINKAIDNPLQVAAHKYSQGVLRGTSDLYFTQHTTPKFERARIVGVDKRETIYISGTAAIRGEASVFEDDIIDQAFITMQNIHRLVSARDCPDIHISHEFQLFRIYVKNKSQMEEVSDYMNANYPGVKFLVVCADICREELLLEIEGIAFVTH